MRRAILAVVLFTACASPSSGDGARQGGSFDTPSPGPLATVRLLFAGDVMLGRGAASIAAADPLGLFEDVRPALSPADVAVANLESPLTMRAHTSANPNALEADPKAAALLAAAGFDAMGLANNHAGDAGPASVVDTIEALGSAGVHAVGAGEDAEEAFAPVVVERAGVRIALLAFDATGGGLRAGAGPGVAWANMARARDAIAVARASADLVVVGLHAGAEYHSGRDPFTAQLARSFAGMGADVVWVSGPHVIRPTFVTDPDGDGHQTVIATSLGNLLFDQSIPGTRRGALLEVLATADGAIAYRVGTAEDLDGRVRFRGWRNPKGDAIALDDAWWSPVRDLPVGDVPSAGRLPALPDGSIVTDASIGDVTGDGEDEVVVAFRRPFRWTPEKLTMPDWPWADASGNAAHLGLWRAADLRPVWVAGTLVRPVSAVAACDGALAVAYSDLDDPATISTSAWVWRGFGFVPLEELTGPGIPACADVNGDGRLEPVVRERSLP